MASPSTISTPDLYQILQVSPLAESEVIRAAYRALAKKYHPDLNSRQASTDRMRLLNEAYAVLSDEARRHDYDLHRRRDMREQAPRQAASMHVHEATLSLGQGLSLVLIKVPAGEFRMGHEPTARISKIRADCEPEHRVSVPDFYLGKYPVTIAQFDAFVRDTGYQTTAEIEGNASVWSKAPWLSVDGADWRHPNGRESSIALKQEHPVTVVTWEDARAFCRWMGQQASVFTRLPSEAEWEKAARGTDGRTWPWGDEHPTAGRVNLGFQGKDTTPVGLYSPSGDSPYGCCDMTGNVWEWTNSAHLTYPYHGNDGREDDSACDVARVMRGGIYWVSFDDVATFHREPRYPLFRSAFTGFRVYVQPG